MDCIHWVEQAPTRKTFPGDNGPSPLRRCRYGVLQGSLVQQVQPELQGREFLVAQADQRVVSHLAGYADVADLALSFQHFQWFEKFSAFEDRPRWAVQLVDIDIVRIEALQALLGCLQNISG